MVKIVFALGDGKFLELSLGFDIEFIPDLSFAICSILKRKSLKITSDQPPEIR
jgi:hypothetical protein